MGRCLLLTVLVAFIQHGCDAGCMHTGTTLHLTELNWDEEVVQGMMLLHIVEFSSPWCIWSGTHSCDDMTEAWKVLGQDFDGHDFIQIGALTGDARVAEVAWKQSEVGERGDCGRLLADTHTTGS